MPQVPSLRDLRAQLDAAFDDAQLDAFCLDHFPEVFERFGRGLRRDEKVTLLLDHCRRRDLLGTLAQRLQPGAVPPSNSEHGFTIREFR